MKKMAVLTCSFILMYMSGCGPSSDEPAITMAAQTTVTATQTRAAMPTEPSKPTPTNSPTPTLTPTPGPGDVLIGSDQGECPVQGVGVNYKTLEETKNYLVENRDEVIYMEISDVTTSLTLFCDTVISPDVQIEFDMEHMSGPDDYAVGLLCRVNLSRWYMLAAFSDGTWAIFKYEYGSGYGMLADGATNAIRVGKSKNHLAAVCEDDLLSLYINDIEVGSVRDSEFTDGKPGWALLTLDHAGVGMGYDNFMVSIPDPDNPPGEPAASDTGECQIISITPNPWFTDPSSGEAIPSYDYVAGGFIPNERVIVVLKNGMSFTEFGRADDQGRISGNVTWGAFGAVEPPTKMSFSLEGEECKLSQAVTWP